MIISYEEFSKKFDQEKLGEKMTRDFLGLPAEGALQGRDTYIFSFYGNGSSSPALKRMLQLVAEGKAKEIYRCGSSCNSGPWGRGYSITEITYQIVC